MVNRLARILLPLTCAGALAFAAPATANAKLTVGISDNGPGMFTQPSFLALHIKTARDMVFWNVAVMRNRTDLKLTRAWVKAAQRAGVTPMISFAGNGNYIPSVPVYTAAIKAFLHDFPTVKVYTPWNEPDWIYRPALANNPGLAAAYFNVLAHYCHHCTIVAGDLYRPAWQGLGAWIRAYKRGLHYRPLAWALHPYDDIRTHTASQIRTVLANTSGQLWFTEISGVLRRGHTNFPNQSGTAANHDERYLFSLPKRFPRITRIYHYQWQGTIGGHWDSGLIGPKGVPRPAYYTVRAAMRGRLP